MGKKPSISNGDGNFTERIPIDLDPKPRFLDDPATQATGVPSPEFPESVVVDMGAYEFAPACNACAQDIDASGEVRVPDLIKLLGCWGPIIDGTCLCLDDDNDFQIRVPDLIALLGKWGVCP